MDRVVEAGGEGQGGAMQGAVRNHDLQVDIPKPVEQVQMLALVQETLAPESPEYLASLGIQKISSSLASLARRWRW